MLVLFVDDNTELLDVTRLFLKRINDVIQLETCISVEEAYLKMEEKTFEIIVSDYQLPNKTGIQFLRELREQGNNIPFIFFTGKGKEEIAAEALRLGAVRYIQKAGDSMSQFIILAQAIEQEVIHWRTAIIKERQIEKLLEKTKTLVIFKKVTEELLKIQERELFTYIREIIKVNFDLRLFWIGLITEENFDVHPIMSSGSEGDYLKNVRTTWDDTLTSKNPTGMAIKTKKFVYHNNIIKNEENDNPWFKEAIEKKCQSAGSFPLIFQDKVIGTANIYSEEEYHFTDTKEEIYQILANLIAFLISRMIEKNNIQTIINADLA